MKTIRPILLCVLCVSILPVTATQTDSLSVFRRTMLDASPAEALPPAVLRNPAAMWYKQTFSFSELSIGYDDSRQGEAAVAQGGDGYGGFGFAARSFVPTGPKGRAFGRAGYTNGTRRNVQWSETADFALLRPYVAADSAGGSLTSETYRFSGGYAHTTGRWTWGACLDYRAQLEYREVDPRPRNVVSDLKGSLAAARSIGPEYRLSLSVRGRKYGQRGDIAFYNDMHQAAVCHMTGLGMDYVRFAGLQTDASYSGWGAGGSVDWFPASRSGFSASVSYDYFTFRKQMTGMNNLPLASAADHSAAATLAYGSRGSAASWGITASGGYRQRSGTEHIFGESTGNIYPEIGATAGYADRIASGTLLGFAGSLPASARTVWWVEPSVSYLDFQSEYPPASRRMAFARWQAGVDGAVMHAWNDRWMLRVQAGAARSGGVNGELVLPGADFSTSRMRTLLANYRYLTDDFTRVRLEVQLNCRFGGDRTAFVRGGWTHDRFAACGTADGWSVSLGFGF